QRAEDALDLVGRLTGWGVPTQRVLRGHLELDSLGNKPRLQGRGDRQQARGNYSGGSIHSTDTAGASVSCTYLANATHCLYLGTRFAETGAKVAARVDNGSQVTLD